MQSIGLRSQYRMCIRSLLRLRLLLLPTTSFDLFTAFQTIAAWPAGKLSGLPDECRQPDRGRLSRAFGGGRSFPGGAIAVRFGDRPDFIQPPRNGRLFRLASAFTPEPGLRAHRLIRSLQL
jgi:hypothetical protein